MDPQVLVHVHLLGIRGTSWIYTGLWDIPDEPSLPTPNILIRENWPGLSTKPITDESWEDVRGVFFRSFEEALNTGIYPRKPIARELTERAVKIAFNASIALQIKVQQQGDTDGSALEARTAMRVFAGRAAVSVLHCWLTFDTHHRRNGSWLAVLLLMMSSGKQKDRQKIYPTGRKASWRY